MTESILDSASLYELLPTLEGGPKGLTEWSWRTSVEVTTLLLAVPTARISPSPEAASAPSGAYGVLTQALQSVIAHGPPSAEVHSLALRRTRSWLAREHTRLSTAFVMLESDELNYQPWLFWCIRRAWPEHASRLGGLFNSMFIPELSRVLGVSTADLTKVHEASQNRTIVKQWADRQHGEAFELARGAYVLSALIRGRYHDTIAHLLNDQILHHPLRHSVLSKPQSGSRREHFEVSVVEKYLAYIAIRTGWNERGLDSRAARWAENVLAIRHELMDLRRSALEASSLEAAEKKAAAIARRAGVKVEPRWVDTAIEVSLALGGAAIAHVALVSWMAGLLVGGAGHEAAHRLHVGRRIASWASTQARLRRMAHAGPGRIEGRWRKEPLGAT